MAFDDFAIIAGRLPATILELDLDACENSYGSSPCTATLARTNMILQSQTLDNGSWTPINSAVTADVVLAPDNTMTAELLDPDDFVANEVKELEQTINATLLTLTNEFTSSVYVKRSDPAGTNLRMFIRTNAIDGAYVDIDLTNGQIIDRGNLGAGAPLVKAKVTQPQGFGVVPPTGWYRVELVFTVASLTTPLLKFALLELGTAANSFVGVDGEGVYLWGAQTRAGATAGIYAVTTTAIVDGLGTVDDICFNTFGTCQDTPNYVKEVKTYRYIDTINTPIEISDAFPAIIQSGVNYTPTRLQPGGDLSIRGKVTIKLQDFTHNDRGGPSATSGSVVDKYARLRTYDPTNRGTHFGKLKARNEFYVGRPMRVLEGYMDAPFSLANFRTREYIIEEIRGPSDTGVVEIIGKDVLSLAINTRAKAPTPSVGSLNGALTSGATTFDVGAGEGAAYDIDVNVRIDDEIIRITTRVVDSFTVVIRGEGGTIAAAHEDGAAVQSCLTFEDIPVIDAIQTLLEDFASVPTSFIPFVDWETEEAASLANYDVETIITEPTGVTRLLKEIMEVTLIDLWYSDVDQEIKLKLETPFTDVTVLITDQDHIIEKSLRARDLQEKRLSRVLIWYGIRNFAADLQEPSNYSLANFEVEADKEGVNKYNDERVKVIFSRWFDATNETQVQLTSQRLLARFSRVPTEISFRVDAKDVNLFDTGDVVDLQSRIIQDATGADKIDRFQIIESRPKFPGSVYEYKALAFFEDPLVTGGVVIPANRTCLDLFVEFGGPPGPVEATLTINAGVVIDALKSCAAITTGALHPDSIITIVNNGEIRGHSGAGGDGGLSQIQCISFPEFPPPGDIAIIPFTETGDAGGAGGDAIEVTIDELIIDNTATGNIFAGGGGGGGGGGNRFALTPGHAAGGGGGGGGRGSDGVGCGGAGGLGVAFIDFACPIALTADGTAGVDGAATGAGAGSAGGNAGGTIGGSGAAGGDWAIAGLQGSAGFSGMGGLGGAPGFAVRKNGAVVTFLAGDNPAQVKGQVA